jgi:hypothetical protein
MMRPTRSNEWFHGNEEHPLWCGAHEIMRPVTTWAHANLFQLSIEFLLCQATLHGASRCQLHRFA